MFEDMAMPDVAAGVSFETGNDPRDHCRFSSDRVLPSGFIGIGWNSRPNVNDLAAVVIGELIEWPAVEDLKTHQMKMDRVNVGSEINQIPDLHRIDYGLFRNRHMPTGSV